VTPCTIWYRHDPIKGWRQNHLEDGHATTDKPMPKFPSQQGWKNGRWERYYGWLSNGKVVWENTK
jgi:hypothetical protein